MLFVEIDGMLSEYFHKSKSRRLFLRFNTERRPEEDMCHAVDKKRDFTLMKKQARSRNISIGINLRNPRTVNK